MPNGPLDERQEEIEEILRRSITASELARKLRVAVGTVYRWLETQEDIPVLLIRTGPRRETPLFPQPEIYQWFEMHEARRRGPK